MKYTISSKSGWMALWKYSKVMASSNSASPATSLNLLMNLSAVSFPWWIVNRLLLAACFAAPLWNASCKSFRNAANVMVFPSILVA